MKIQYRKVPKHWKYQLLKEYRQWLDILLPPLTTEFIWIDNYQDKTLLTIKKYYAWDGSTVAMDTKKCMRASLVHDAFYFLFREGLLPLSYRKFADKLYRDMIIEDGKEIIEKGPKWLRWPRMKILWGWAGVRYTGLRIYAGWNWIWRRK